MDVERIIELTQTHTTVYRKGAVFYHNGQEIDPPRTDEEAQALLRKGGVTEVFNYPAKPENGDVIDMVFIYVGCEITETTAQELRDAIGGYVFPDSGADLRHGLSYIHLGAELGSQENALRFMALGAALGMWGIMTLKSMYPDAPEQTVVDMAGRGYLYTSPMQERAK